MSSPIINPWLVYTINTINNLSLVSSVAIGIGTVGFIIGIIAYLIWRNNDYCAIDEDCVACDKKLRLYLNRLGIVLIIILLLNIVIPAKETMYTMLAMRYVTVENINGGIETVKSAVDYVFEKIEELDDSKENNNENQ